MKLAIAQMVLGVFIVGNYAAWVCHYPWSLPLAYRLFPYAIDSSISPFSLSLSLVLGLAVLGCGIAQFIKARRVESEKAD